MEYLKSLLLTQNFTTTLIKKFQIKTYILSSQQDKTKATHRFFKNKLFKKRVEEGKILLK